MSSIYDKQFAVVFARDPLNQTTLSYLLTSGSVDQDKLRPFLEKLKQDGIVPEVTITDQSHLYPSLLTELWTECRHQLCLFHFTKEVVEQVLTAARTIEAALPKSKKRRRGRPSKRGRPRKDSQKRELKKKARKARRPSGSQSVGDGGNRKRSYGVHGGGGRAAQRTSTKPEAGERVNGPGSGWHVLCVTQHLLIEWDYRSAGSSGQFGAAAGDRWRCSLGPKPSPPSAPSRPEIHRPQPRFKTGPEPLSYGPAGELL